MILPKRQDRHGQSPDRFLGDGDNERDGARGITSLAVFIVVGITIPGPSLRLRNADARRRRALSIRLKAFRQPGRLAFGRLVALKTGHPGAAAAAGVRTFPGLVGMVLANPAGVLAEQALHRAALSQRHQRYAQFGGLPEFHNDPGCPEVFNIDQRIEHCVAHNSPSPPGPLAFIGDENAGCAPAFL
jgi:hypothetical protein